MSQFAELEIDEELIKATLELGYSRATTIQQMVIPHALDAKDILASAPTGTGKTAAFLLPALQHLLDFPRSKSAGHFARILILAPTRELAEQIYKNAKQLAKFTEFSVRLITGGINYGKHKELLESEVDILVATPGRLLEFIENESFECRDVEWLVLDEADRMLDMGFKPVMERIAGEARWRKQTLLFSATLEGRGIDSFAKGVLNDPVLLEAEPPRRESNKIHQWVHLADSREHKNELLKAILADEKATKVVIFVKTRERVAELSSYLIAADVPCCWLQGEMPQDKRLNAVSRFTKDKVNVLVATDVAARGLDIDNISHVINYDMPRTADVYVHRIGRTGRAGKKGTAISLVEAHDVAVTQKIERYTKEVLKRRVIEGLEPKHKEAKVPAKKKTKKKKVKEKPVKVRKPKGRGPAKPKAAKS
ncbi:ATP-dependent RNA helicase SrmB [Catenovulum sp. SM1970]|uniref:ATP-dependent RNA helicase SrmB n=1 Tax=Marinifaba aquimaris TaxID=2741323 RepID=UPI001572D44E|nr:ATP-dependent RNA helicase SrmB [Marinifaba aquimaris]NTS77978.1 ATP-dependent RNA helicase SrmB [Marinifaba aquimaris]